MSNEKLATLRAAVKKDPSRPVFHLYAFLRGRPLASLEARVSEHNLPSVYRASRLWKELFQEAAPPALAEWLKVPEERIKRFGPRQPRQRPQSRLVAAAGLAVALSVSSPTSPEADPRGGCLDALVREDIPGIVRTCKPAEVSAELASVLGGK